MKTIIISNRLPVKVKRTDKGLTITESEGGLATGLGSLFPSENNIWIGWPGLEVTDKEEQVFITKELLKQNLIPLFLTENEVECFYEGFANEIIWPICHYRPSYSIFDRKSWLFYRQVNKKFLSLAEQYIKEGDTIWIHDYHLMLLPSLLRKKFSDVRIGYFQHIPFPSHEVFKLIPWRNELLEGILGADLAGFHTEDDVHYFQNACHRILNKKISKNHIFNSNRKTKTAAFPMGIDAEKFKKISQERRTNVQAKLLKRHLHQNKIILSIDRLDYSKGIVERIKAIEELLNQYPEYKEKITFIQLIVPSRDTVKQYKLLKDEIDRSVGEVNSKFANSHWAPIQYFYNSYPIDKVCALYKAADVCLVTPIRDGMNLVCKEFVACNSTEDSNGVLILSEMAGAAEEMRETIIINPNDIEQMAQAIHKGLTMNLHEQQVTLQSLAEKIFKNDVNEWLKNYMNDLKKTTSDKPSKTLISEKTIELVKRKLRSRKKPSLFFLDYDGTLVGFKNDPKNAAPTKEVIELLTSLKETENNHVVLISGRDQPTMDEWFSSLGIHLVAEHGAWRFDPNKGWETLGTPNSDWKPAIKKIIQKTIDLHPQTFIEEKTYSLAWHYRTLNPTKAATIKSELERKILNLKEYTINKLEIMDGDKVLEIKPNFIDKGKAARSYIDKLNPEFILAIGDDYTDENTFKVLPAHAFSIKVGNKPTLARYYCNSQKEALNFLKQISEPIGKNTPKQPSLSLNQK